MEPENCTLRATLIKGNSPAGLDVKYDVVTSYGKLMEIVGRGSGCSYEGQRRNRRRICCGGDGSERYRHCADRTAGNFPVKYLTE